MKIFKSFFLVFILFGVIGCNQTEKKSNEGKDENVVTDTAEREVAAAVDTLNNIIVNPDKYVLDRIAAEELTYGHSGGLVQNKEEFIDDLINGDFDFSSVNGLDQEIHIAGETAIVRQIFSAEATNAGEPVNIRIGNMLVYQKQDGHWKLLARQAFKL